VVIAKLAVNIRQDCILAQFVEQKFAHFVWSLTKGFVFYVKGR